MRLLSRRVLVYTIVGLVAAGTWATAIGVARQRAASSMATAATAFLASLTPEQREQAVYPLASEEWTRWNFIPINTFPRNGLPLKDMTEAQRESAHALLQASLSQGGYETVTSVMSLESILWEIEEAERAAAAAAPPPPPPPPDAQQAGRGRGRGGRGRGGAPTIWVRDPLMYYLTVFGQPSASGQWGFRVEGHHVSLHFSVDSGQAKVVSGPQFIGSNPAEVREGPRSGFRALAAQEDAARALLMALDDAARAVAHVSEDPRGFSSGTDVRVEDMEPVGLMAGDMNDAQRSLLMAAIDAYVGVMPTDVAAERKAEIEAAGVENISFAWSGSTERRQPYQYQILGPTFLVEHNNTQNSGNHIHAAWRDREGDFGRSLIAEHMAAIPH